LELTTMSSKMSQDRFERASVLCDLARAFVEANGNPTPGITPPLVEVECEGLAIRYCDNFPGGNLGNNYLIVDDEREPNSKRRRKLSVYWHDDGRTMVSGFRPGDWQERLMKLIPIASVAKVH
jgi:hypothetical protein